MKERLIQLLAQGFGSGRAPGAPGTVGSRAGLLWFGLLLQTGSLWGFLLGSLGAVAAAVWLCGEAERVLGQKDPGSIVLDEIVAVPLCFLSWIGGQMIRGGQFPGPEEFFSGSQVWGLAGVFVLFRVFDVAKPWPARQSQNLPGGWGVTLDDVAAAAWVNVVMGFVVLGVIQGSTVEDSTRAGGVQQGLSEEEVVQGFLALEQERREWDSTVWAADLIAERHEDIFIRFWDDLRRSGHAADLIAGFPVGRIAIPQPLVQTTSEWGIVTTRFGANGSELDQPEWRRWVLARAAEGFEVEQSEWRQTRFEPAGSAEEGARSVFNIRLHVRRPDSNERYILTGPLRVDWAPQPRAQAPPVAHRIDPAERSRVGLEGRRAVSFSRSERALRQRA
jgi:phosphatidylglycerophosphatase A